MYKGARSTSYSDTLRTQLLSELQAGLLQKLPDMRAQLENLSGVPERVVRRYSKSGERHKGDVGPGKLNFDLLS